MGVLHTHGFLPPHDDRHERRLCRRQVFLKNGLQAALHAITPNDDFYSCLARRTGGGPGEVVAHNRRAGGAAAAPGYDEVRKLAPFETTHSSASPTRSAEGRVGNAVWRGSLLARCWSAPASASQAKYVVLYAAEGYSTGHCVECILRPDNFLAWEMNGSAAAQAARCACSSPEFTG